MIVSVSFTGALRNKTLWSWSAEKDDIILNGTLVVKKAIPVIEVDRCPCGTMGEIRPPAVCICPACGKIIWGC
jgi:hypothetical protein